MWTVIIGRGKSPIKWAKIPSTTRKSSAKLSHIAKVQGRLEPALARGESLRISNAMFYPLGHGWPSGYQEVYARPSKPQNWNPPI